MPDFDTSEAGAPAHRLAPAAPDEEYVFGACSPGWHSAADHSASTADWIQSMRANDIERVCCLLPGCESPSDVDAKLFDDGFGADRTLHAPVPDGRLVNPALLKQEVIPFLEAAVEAEERVVVVCLDGMGRTGQVLAAWLAHDRGFGPNRAIETVESTGRLPCEPVYADNASEQELIDLLAIFA